MSEASSRVLTKMLERLFAAIVGGPCMNCRPQSSRQRVDMRALAALQDTTPEVALAGLLSEGAEATIKARVPRPSEGDASAAVTEGRDETDDEQARPRWPWQQQQKILQKLRVIAEESREYENDTGVHALAVGFPLLSVPPGSGLAAAARGTASSARVLAPVALIPVLIEVTAGSTPCVTLSCRGTDADRVQPNEALLAWIEQQTGRRPEQVFTDSDGADPYREITELTQFVCRALEIEVPEWMAKVADTPPAALQPAVAEDSTGSPRRPSIMQSAVLGLFPLANQGLLRDTQAMLAGEDSTGPVLSFLRAGALLDETMPAPDVPLDEPKPAAKHRDIEQERLITWADPFQSRAVRLSRSCPALVIHGPPGTGKSQTITNIIGDHLSRGERVLFVCDKRTALDVVADRLDALGLGALCAVVHDPHRDPRDLFKSIRDQVESLAETRTPLGSESELARINAELMRLQTELDECWRGLMMPPNADARNTAAAMAMHELVGAWLAAGGLDVGSENEPPSTAATLEALDAAMLDVEDGLGRAHRVELAANPWARAAGLPLNELLRTPMPPLRNALAAAVEAARRADELIDPDQLPFAPDGDLLDQARSRAGIGSQLNLAITLDASTRARWSALSPADVTKLHTSLRTCSAAAELLSASSPDSELLMVARGMSPPIAVAAIAMQIGSLEQYLASARGFFGFLAFGAKKAAANVLKAFGLPLDLQAAERLLAFLKQVRAAMLLQNTVAEIEGRLATAGLPDIADVFTSYRGHALLAAMITAADTDPDGDALGQRLRATLQSPDDARRLAATLAECPARAEALVKLEQSAGACGLLDKLWVQRHALSWRRGHRAGDELGMLLSKLPTLEDVVRCAELVRKLGEDLGPMLQTQMEQGAEPAAGARNIRRRVIRGEIWRRLEADPNLMALDGRRIEATFSRFEQLEAQKLNAVTSVAKARWLEAQRRRLLVSTGSRLNALGASMKQRLIVRGSRALKLRQVIALGMEVDGGDPLLDLRPVWMVSPETVAQVFPRTAIFDVVIFDEASQCRLEEALPVLTRGKRVVIAGDPKQLPPTRFFESAVAASETDRIETEQDLFESQQSQIEDLLTAALNLDVQQCYLDVHYRSRNADLIAFSNEQFYSSRLVPIPGHPRNRAKFPPLSLVRVAGVYHERRNEPEADRVVAIVKDLLRRAEPPSIGIACFNVTQRDLLNRRLDDAAMDDPEFASRLAEARLKRGHSGFEGLFVKNLENVQGDERDHIIISTTYGPDKSGKFFRRFGPLGMAGGGRRLNVLVTRARHEVHLVSSIPPDVYRSLPMIPMGQSPTGGWLLMSYLQFAERLEDLYRLRRDEQSHETECADNARGSQPGDSSTPSPTLRVADSAHPSLFAMGTAKSLLERHKIGGCVHWGNDGFCIDAALDHPTRPGDVTIGVICDLTRFAQAEDPIEWDMFRHRVLRSQGWTLHRLWSPSFVRDPEGRLDEIVALAAQEGAERDDPESLRVVR